MQKDLRDNSTGVSGCGSNSHSLLACREILVRTEGVIVKPQGPGQIEERKEKRTWVQGHTLLKEP